MDYKIVTYVEAKKIRSDYPKSEFWYGELWKNESKILVKIKTG